MSDQDKLREALLHRWDRCASIETAARKVIDAVDPLTPNEWAFETPTSIRHAIIELEAALFPGSRLFGSNPPEESGN